MKALLVLLGLAAAHYHHRMPDRNYTAQQTMALNMLPRFNSEGWLLSRSKDEFFNQFKLNPFPSNFVKGQMGDNLPR